MNESCLWMKRLSESLEKTFFSFHSESVFLNYYTITYKDSPLFCFWMNLCFWAIHLNEWLSDSLSKTSLTCCHILAHQQIHTAHRFWVHRPALQLLYIPTIILVIHISTQKKRTNLRGVVEQQFSSCVYLSFLLLYSQLKPLILPWGLEKMKVACGEPSGLECWCLYAVLVGVVLEHCTQAIYCAVHSQINEDRRLHLLHLQNRVIEKVWGNRWGNFICSNDFVIKSLNWGKGSMVNVTSRCCCVFMKISTVLWIL